MGALQSHKIDEEVKKLSLSEQEMLELLEKEETIRDSFGLDREELTEVWNATEEQLDTIFRVFDQHSRGKIDAYEFIAGMTILADASLETKAHLLFELFDFDHSKSITFDEMIVILKTSMSAFCCIGNSQMLEAAELKEHAERVFYKVDTNMDNEVSLAEWVSFVTKDTEAVQMLQKFQLVSEEDLRQNWGTEEEPEVDSDLENETDNRSWTRSDAYEKAKEVGFELEDVGQGDQFLAAKASQGAVTNSTPSNYAPESNSKEPPNASLDLEYIYGYRCHDVRNNLRYTALGEVVYHTAAVGVVLNQESNTQRHFLAHSDDIISFDLSSDGNLAATGEVGRNPLVCVWNTQTLECVASFKGILKKGVARVCFSKDCSKIAAMGADDQNTVVVYDLHAENNVKQVHAIGTAGRAKILDMKFHPSYPNKLVVCGLRILQVMTIENGTFKVKKGTGWGKDERSKQQALISLGFLGNNILAGGHNGCLFIWKGTELSRAVKLHEGSISCIGPRYGEEGIVTGGTEGHVYVLDGSLKKVDSVNLRKLKSLAAKPRSVCEKQGKLLVGTRGGEVIEVEGRTAKVLMRSHFHKELWGLTKHPSEPLFATVGEDSMLAVWELLNCKQKNSCKVEGPANTLSYSSDGLQLSVGFQNGKVIVYDSETLEEVVQKHDRRKPISQIKYSLDGNYLAVGGHDCFIYVYKATENYKLEFKLQGHVSAITHLDFSAEGNALQSNSSSYEILFHDLTTGELNPSGASEYRDLEWSTWSCVIGWPVQGIWPASSDGTDVNAVERSKSSKVLASADDFGQVKLFRYPCPEKNSAFNVYHGHSSHVTNLAFTGDYLISVGGNDKSIFQWRYLEEEEELVSTEGASEVEDFFEIDEIGKGDQFLAVKPWKGEVEASRPSNLELSPDHKDAPQDSLSLLKVLGFRSFDSRNNLKVTRAGKIVYPAAALGVVMDPSSSLQEFFTGHQEDVVCLAIHPFKDLVATGQMARTGKSREIDLFVWDTETLEAVSQLSGFHRKAIRHVGFSPDGSLLLSVGEDSDHSLAVYDWKHKRLVCSSKVDKERVLGASFVNNSQICIFGLKFIKFFTIKGKNVSVRRGVVGSTTKRLEAQICGEPFMEHFVTGTHAGNLYVWSNSSLSKTVKAHNSQVWSLCVKEDKLLSGGSDGVVNSWDSKLNQLQTFSLSNYSLSAGIRAIDVDQAGNLLLGTRGAEIFCVKNWEEPQMLVSGHFQGELWGLAMHPSEALCATCGGDKTVRVWDLLEGKQKLAVTLEKDSRAIDWSVDGSLLVLGLVDGSVLLLSAADLSVVSELESSFGGKDSWIQDIKFSPEGNKVAFGTHGGPSKVEIAGVENSQLFRMHTVDVGLSSALTHLEWSTDGKLLAVNSQAYELKFISVEEQKSVSSSSVKETEWFGWTCVLGWPVEHIWPKGSDGTDINCCAKSRNNKVLATADDYGKVNLFRYPVAVEGQGSNSYGGHSSHVTKVRFSCDDSFVVSTGGNDKCVFVWKTEMEELEEDTEPQEMEEELVLKDKSKTQEKSKQKLEKALESNNPNSYFNLEDMGEGDQFMAVKPGKGSMRPPSNFKRLPRNQTRPPNVRVELEFVHGYRAKDSRNNLRYLPDGKIIYHAAGLGIVYQKQTHSQQFFNKHSDDIIAFSVSKSGNLAASGEVGRWPSIYVWNTYSMVPVAHFKKPLQKGIAALDFSPSETKLVAAGLDDNHSIAVYNLNTNALVASFKGDTNKILDLAWISEGEFVTTGVKHYKLWRISGSRVKASRGKFGKLNSCLVGLTVQGNTALCGNLTGHLIRWQGSTPTKAAQVHSKALDSLWAGNSVIVSGGKDGFVFILDNEFNKRQSFDFNSLNLMSPMVRSACLNQFGDTLLVGTYGCEIMEVDLRVGQSRTLIKGHYTPNRGRTVTNEIWGLEAFPDGDTYATASDDGTLRIWSISQRAQLHSIRFSRDEVITENEKVRCLSLHPRGRLLAVGFKDGSFGILDTSSWEFTVRKKCAREMISQVKFSPDGSKLAVGSNDNNIDIYTVPEFNKVGECRGHSSYITHIDWSCDSQFLQSNCGAYELLFWDANTAKQIPSGASMLRDEDWGTWSCVIGWPVQGIFPPYSDGTDVNAVDRSKRYFGNREYRLLATSDDFGLVKVFRYPCVESGSEGQIGKGHSSHVTNVKFNSTDQYLISTGGDDQCVFQWRIS